MKVYKDWIKKMWFKKNSSKRIDKINWEKVVKKIILGKVEVKGKYMNKGVLKDHERKCCNLLR